MNILTTYFYKGANDNDVESTYICINGHCYVTGYIDVMIYYGQYVGANQPLAIPPINLPAMTNVEFVQAQIYRSNNDTGLPQTKFAAAKLIASQPVFDIDNPHSCLGTKFTFQSPVMEDCDHPYCLVWSTSNIEMPYGANLIVIDGQSNYSDSWWPCD